MNREEMEGIVLKEKEKRISMNNVPKETKKLFVELANENFSDNYGSTLKWCLEQALEYQEMKEIFLENINLKLDILINSKKESQLKSEEFTTRRMLGGNVIRFKKKEVKNE